MKILIDIGHPAHVHYYKNMIKELDSKGHSFLIIARDRNVIFDLLDHYQLKYASRGKGKTSLMGKLFYSIYALSVVFFNAIKFKPDVFLSQGGVYTAPIAWIMNKTSISTEDTENATASHKIAKLFGSYILSPSCFKNEISDRHFKFNCYQELLYLAPNYFTPNPGVYSDLGILETQKFVIVRFVDWNAHHDIGHKGMSLENKRILVEKMSEIAKVFILSEQELPEDLEPYKIAIHPTKMHDVLSFASLLFGESATMASECACLGTPAIYLDDEGRGYTNEQEELYGLVFNYSESNNDQLKSIDKAIEIVKSEKSGKTWKQLQESLLKDKIDGTRFLISIFDEYPSSLRELLREKENPNHLTS